MQHPHPLTQITFTPCPQHERTDPMCAPRWRPCMRTFTPKAAFGHAAPGQTVLVVGCEPRELHQSSIASIPEHLMLSQYAPENRRFLTCPYALTTCNRSWWSNMTSANIGRRANITRGGRPRVESLGAVTPQSVFVSCEDTHAFK
jgi:hypothetical protein